MDKQIQTRLAGVDDTAEVVRLVKALALDDGEVSPVSEAYVSEYLAFPGSNILLAVEGVQVLGLLSFSIRPNLYHAGGSCLIEELIVDERARSRGIGGLLVEAVKKRAEAAGCAEISVSTMPDNSGAIRFYHSHGFGDEAVYLEQHFH